MGRTLGALKKRLPYSLEIWHRRFNTGKNAWFAGRAIAACSHHQTAPQTH
jgi:hypothetical protein